MAPGLGSYERGGEEEGINPFQAKTKSNTHLPSRSRGSICTGAARGRVTPGRFSGRMAAAPFEKDCGERAQDVLGGGKAPGGRETACYGEGTRGGRRSKTFRSHAIPETGQVPHGDHADASAPLCPDSPKGRVKQEVIKIESEVKEKKSRSLGKTLAAAAAH